MQHGKWQYAKQEVWDNFPPMWYRQCTQKLQGTTLVATSTQWIPKKHSDNHFTVVIVAVNSGPY